MRTCVVEFGGCGKLHTATQERHVIQKLETMDNMRMHADVFLALYKDTLKVKTNFLQDFCMELFLYSGRSSDSQ